MQAESEDKNKRFEKTDNETDNKADIKADIKEIPKAAAELMHPDDIDKAAFLYGSPSGGKCRSISEMTELVDIIMMNGDTEKKH